MADYKSIAESKNFIGLGGTPRIGVKSHAKASASAC